VKLALETLATVPEDPPAAGPERAFDPPAPAPGAAANAPPATDWPADADWDMARPTETPITGIIRAAAAIHPLLLFGSNRRTTDGLDVPLATGRGGGVSWGFVGS
jgi:hypothetical protein